MKKIIIFLVIAISIVILSVVLFFTVFEQRDRQVKTDSYTIIQKWELPKILEEVSDIAWIDKDLIAAVQDEKGIIFLYDLKESKIVKKINFAGNGDYEGMAIDGNTAYIVRSDGKIFEIKNFQSENFAVNKYETPLTEKQDIEGLALDRKNKRLLLSVKEKEPGDKNYKGIYGFDLIAKKLQEEPVYKIKFEDPIFKKVNADKKAKTIRPSEIGIRQKTEQLFILDAKIPMLVIYSINGDSQKIYFLNKEEFKQPEGLTFSSTGSLYISNEGKKDEPGNILMVELK